MTLSDIKLPEPDFKKPIIQALKNQRSIKSFDDKDLSDQELSEVLWAAFGINRPETGGRTAPSGGNSQETDIYVILKKGTYLYNPQEHRLDLVTNENLQSILVTQVYAKSVPVHLAYVANLNKFTQKLPIEYTMMHSGSIAQNVNIYCASVGLGSVMRSPRDSGRLHKALNLREDQKVTVWHAIGYVNVGGDIPSEPGKGGSTPTGEGGIITPLVRPQ